MKILYQLKQVAKSIIHNKLINIFMYVSLVIGLICVMFTYVLFMWNYETIQNTDNIKKSFRTLENAVISSKDITKILSDNKDIIAIEKQGYLLTNVSYQDTFIDSLYLYITDEATLTLNENYELLHGKYFDEKTSVEYTCVVNNSFVKDIMKLSESEAVSKIINVSGKDYEIIGVYKEKVEGFYQTRVNLPIELFTDILNKQIKIDYNVISKKEVLAELKEYLSNELDIYMSSDLLLAMPTEEEAKAQFILSLLLQIFMVTSVLLFALLNIVNVYRSKLQDDKVNIGIKRALGLSKNEIYLQYFIEIFIISLISAISSMFLSMIIINIFNKLKILPIITLNYDLIFITFIIIITLIVSTFLTGIVISSQKNKSITQLMTK